MGVSFKNLAKAKKSCNSGNILQADLSSLIGNFDREYSTVWKFSHFPASPATLILLEIDFGRFQRVQKNVVSTILEALNFNFL